MGSDDLFHRRKAKSRREHSRKKASRASYDRVLIVTEGGKTEPLYLEDLCGYNKLSSANIKITGECDSCPLKLVEFAETLYSSDKKSGDSYNKVFCVIDRDDHANFQRAIQLVKNINNKLERDNLRETTEFIVICSTPCFEYWLLLHFKETTKPFTSTKQRTAAQHVISELKHYLPKYKKAESGLFTHLTETKLTKQAIQKSKRIYQSSLKTGNKNPSTNMHELVEYLENLKKDK